MADALLELAEVLPQLKDPKMSIQEGKLIQACKSKAIRDFSLGGALAGGLVVLATGKLSGFFRTSLAGGAGFLSGMYSINKSLETCVDHILAMEGTRMKHELAKIMVRRYANAPYGMHLLSKHFFLEEVFDDSVSDQPKRMYRQRNSFIDNAAAQIQKSADTYGYDESEGDKKINNSQQEENDFERLRNAAGDSKQRSVVIDIMEQDDLLDSLFGYSDVDKDVLHPNYTSNNPTKQQSRRQRRLHRRHRLHHQHHGRDNASNVDNT